MGLFKLTDKYITTNRLIIRPTSIADISDVYLQALNDPAVVGMTEARHQTWDRSLVEQFIVMNAEDTSSILFSVFRKESHQPIGNVRLFNIHKLHRRAELSMLFYDKAQWGNGFATEAISNVIKYAFDVLKLQRIYADYYAINKASASVFRKLNFQVEGVFKEHFLYNNEFIDSIRIALLKHEC